MLIGISAVVKYLYGYQKWNWLLVVLFTLLYSILLNVQPLLLRYVVDSSSITDAFGWLYYFTAAQIVGILIDTTLYRKRFKMNMNRKIKTSTNIIQQLFDNNNDLFHILNTPASFYPDILYTDGWNLFWFGVNTVYNVLLWSLQIFGSLLIIFVFYSSLDPWVYVFPFLFISGYGIIYILLMHFNPTLTELILACDVLNRSLFAWIGTTVESMLSIRMSYRQSSWRKELQVRLSKYSEQEHKIQTNTAKTNLCISMYSELFGNWIWLMILLQQYYQGNCPYGSFLSLFTYIQNIKICMEAGLLLFIHQWPLTQPAYKRIKQIYKPVHNNDLIQIQIHPDSNESKQEILYNQESNQLSLRNISIQYKHETILENINLVFDAQKMYVITGPSGAGKTSLLNTILQVRCPTNEKLSLATIMTDGILPFDIDEYYRLFHYTPKDPVIIWASLEANLLLEMKSKKNVDDPEIEKQLRMLLEKLKLNYLYDQQNKNMKVITSFDGCDSRLSKGQIQKIQMIRSCLHESRPFWILDEPTEAVDPKTELDVLQLLKLYRGTVIIVSHRESVIKSADVVLTLDPVSKSITVRNNNQYRG